MNPPEASTTVATPAFDISPEVVFRLGDELITDELQALVELVKNSYDASATSVTVEVDTSTPLEADVEPEGNETPVTKLDEDEPQSAPEMAGWVEVIDNGDGMTREQIDNGWLLISGSAKRTMKREGRENRLGRVPLGDKGLGRLGVLRLGNQVEIRTRPLSRDEEHILRFTRSDFERKDALSDVELYYDRRDLEPVAGASDSWQLRSPFDQDVACSAVPGRAGTVIRVGGLNAPEVWTDRPRVQREMLSLVSPFEEISQFDLTVYIDDPSRANPLELGKLADIRRDLADSRWRFDFDGDALNVQARFKLEAFKPARTNERLSALWDERIAPDGGAEYRDRLISGPLQQFETSAPEGPWWLGVAFAIHAADVAGGATTRRRKRSAQSVAFTWDDPGTFHGELDSFSLARDASLTAGARQVFADYDVYSRWVREVRGMKVFRDGFGIRVGDDFLGLGAGFTGAQSFYALRPGNTVGYVALTARGNQALQETTDREGFVSNGPYRSFRALIASLVDRINVIQSQVGRELADWARDGVPPVAPTPSRRAAELAAAIAEREEQTRTTTDAVGSIQRTLRELSSGGALLTPEQTHDAREADRLLGDLRALMETGMNLRKELEDLAESSREVEHERAQLRDQLRIAYQTVGLGIVAETVAHELTNITGRLQATADSLRPQFQGPDQRAARALASEVRTGVRAIRLQLRHLEPQLRYQRMRRETLDLGELVADAATYHRDRLAPQDVAVKVAGAGFTVRVNRGRIQQAFDNLLINSEFWLRHHEPPAPTIEVDLDEPLVRVRDNGPGVDPSLEGAIFEPFVSGRVGDEGRGLGLFIARQVLGDDAVTISLGRRDADGRRREFVLDFSGATVGPHD